MTGEISLAFTLETLPIRKPRVKDATFAGRRIMT
jgi:hypothetical protein